MKFLENVSAEWLESQYRRWQEDPTLLSADWQAFFAGFDLGRETTPTPAVPTAELQTFLKQSGVQSLIYRYRDIGHLLACTDPLSPCPISHPLLDLSAFGLDDGDLDTVFHTRRYMKESATLRDILETMRETYCRSIGVEFMHITEPSERQWLIDRMEPILNRTALSPEEQRELLGRLTDAAIFEAFLHRRFPGQKRFSLEGGEVLVVLLDQVANRAAESGLTELVLGMAHRGRLNVLANLMGKPLANIFAEFADNLEHGFVGEGDVKYHKGFSADREFPGGQELHLSLAFNPSHLEAVDPVVEGKSRAVQDRLGPGGRTKLLPVLVHGDAAFAGQGGSPRPSIFPNWKGTGPAGPCTWFSTIRSVSPPFRQTPAPPDTQPIWPRC